MILTPLQKLPNNAGDLGKIIVATCFEWLPEVQKNRPIWSHWRQPLRVCAIRKTDTESCRHKLILA